MTDRSQSGALSSDELCGTCGKDKQSHVWANHNWVARSSKVVSLVEVLRSGRQADPDGVEVRISRQAVEEAAKVIENQRATIEFVNKQVHSVTPDWNAVFRWLDESLALDGNKPPQVETRTGGSHEQMREALISSVSVIQTWHNIGVPPKQASTLWDLYWLNAPELKLIREALAPKAAETQWFKGDDTEPCENCGQYFSAHGAGLRCAPANGGEQR